MKYSLIIFDRKDRNTAIHIITGNWTFRVDAAVFGARFCNVFYPNDTNILYRVVETQI